MLPYKFIYKDAEAKDVSTDPREAGHDEGIFRYSAVAAEASSSKTSHMAFGVPVLQCADAIRVSN